MTTQKTTVKRMTDEEFQAYHDQLTIKAAKEQLSRLSNMFRDCSEKMTRAVETLEEPTFGNKVEPNTRMEWAINEVENMMRNINFSTLASHVAKLSQIGN